MKFFINMIGHLFLLAQKAGERVKIQNYMKRFPECGKNVTIAPDCVMIPEHIRIGSNVSIGYGCSLLASIAYINIGNNVMIAPGGVIRGGGHRTDLIGKYMIDVRDNEKLPENDRDVNIEDDVWIGQNAIILKGVTIGKGSVVGAGAIVTKTIPPYTIHVGVNSPKEWPRFTEAEIEEHEQLLKRKL